MNVYIFFTSKPNDGLLLFAPVEVFLKYWECIRVYEDQISIQLQKVHAFWPTTCVYSS